MKGLWCRLARDQWAGPLCWGLQLSVSVKFSLEPSRFFQRRLLYLDSCLVNLNLTVFLIVSRRSGFTYTVFHLMLCFQPGPFPHFTQPAVSRALLAPLHQRITFCLLWGVGTATLGSNYTLKEFLLIPLFSAPCLVSAGFWAFLRGNQEISVGT